jgi:sugar (pentulose or hexulose) kinase
MSTPVIAIFDIGKTNKKVFLFDEDYRIRYEQVVELPETKDEDGYPCEDLNVLSRWVLNTFQELLAKREFDIRAINVSAYGASLVHLDDKNNPITPLYNYLKPYPEDLHNRFYNTYGNPMDLARITASPVLGNLNSGMQLYRLKYEQPEIFQRIRYSLHLPEYISYLFSGKPTTSLTSMGCHTQLWDFSMNHYHNWAVKEGIDKKFPPITPHTETTTLNTHNHTIAIGTGLHDSSAALIPYLDSFHEPFVLISTGTWSISLNPFNHLPLTDDELLHDCLCYLSYTGKPVKASRFFLGFRHEEAIERLAEKWHVMKERFLEVIYEESLAEAMLSLATSGNNDEFALLNSIPESYHFIIARLVLEQKRSTGLILQNTSENIYVDGGFSRNKLFVPMLKKLYPDHRVSSAELHQASSIGAAIAIHQSWNKKLIQSNLIHLTEFK